MVPSGLAALDLSTAPRIDPVLYPDGANVEFITVDGPDALTMRVHERGVGETRSCGISAASGARRNAEFGRRRPDGRRRSRGRALAAACVIPACRSMALAKAWAGPCCSARCSATRRVWIDGAALMAPAVWGRAEMPWYARAPLRVLAHSWLRHEGPG